MPIARDGLTHAFHLWRLLISSDRRDLHDLTSSYDSLIIAGSTGVCSGGTTVLTV
jgi:hypothetical protein